MSKNTFWVLKNENGVPVTIVTRKTKPKLGNWERFIPQSCCDLTLDVSEATEESVIEFGCGDINNMRLFVDWKGMDLDNAVNWLNVNQSHLGTWSLSGSILTVTGSFCEGAYLLLK